MSVYTVPALNAVDFALTAHTVPSLASPANALQSYTVPALNAVDFALTTTTPPTYMDVGWELLPDPGGGPVEGPANQTLGALTQSATGRLLIQGVAGQTLGTLTQSATGRLLITGQAAQTLGALTQVALGELTGLTPTVEDTRGKGGWDPYHYKRRPKRKGKKREEVEQFLSETAQLEAAPEVIQEAAEAARDAAEDYLAALHQASQREAQRLLAEALDRIDEFYEAARELAEEEEEIELLLLS